MNGMSHYYLGGEVVQITTKPIWVILYCIWSISLILCNKIYARVHNITFSGHLKFRQHSAKH